MNIKLLPIYLTFLLMGVADAMGPLSNAVSSIPFMAALMPFFVFIAFAIFSVPGGTLAARIGKKKLLLTGLGLSLASTAVPTFFNPSFPFLLAAIFLLGVGTTFLQVAGNPIINDLSREGYYSKNLALAQGIKGVGSSVSSYLVTAVTSLVFLAAMGWRGAFPIFFVFMLIAFISVGMLKIDESVAEVPPGLSRSFKLLKKPVFTFSVIGIFLYVGAEVCMATFLKPIFMSYGFTPQKSALLGPGLFFGALTLGRLTVGSMKFAPLKAFRASAFVGITGLLLIFSGLKFLIIISVILGGLGFANIWPMLFSITIEKRPEHSSELSGLMCMAISGGAFIPLLMGKLGGGSGPFPFFVPLICFIYLVILSIRWEKLRKLSEGI